MISRTVRTLVRSRTPKSWQTQSQLHAYRPHVHLLPARAAPAVPEPNYLSMLHAVTCLAQPSCIQDVPGGCSRLSK
eukprot:5704409-Alexandrium_andersonii.AAC.1